MRAISEGLRQEAGEKLRVTVVSPGFVQTDFIDTVSNPAVRTQLAVARDRMAISPEAVAGAMVYAIKQPADVDVDEIVIRPTVQA